jgi:excisionase family DNA binding protein
VWAVSIPAELNPARTDSLIHKHAEKRLAPVERVKRGIAVIYYSVAELAKALRVKPEKVQLWIRAGELAAFNVASRPTGQPQWRITAEALAAFQARRAAKTTEPPVTPPQRLARRHRPPMKEILS